MLRRTFLGRALALLGAPAVLAAGCTGSGVEQPTKYSDRPTDPPQGGGGKQTAGGGGKKGPQDGQNDSP